MRLSKSQPRMKTLRFACAIADLNAAKYDSASMKNARRRARSTRQQLRPGTSNATSFFSFYDPLRPRVVAIVSRLGAKHFGNRAEPEIRAKSGSFSANIPAQ